MQTTMMDVKYATPNAKVSDEKRELARTIELYNN